MKFCDSYCRHGGVCTLESNHEGDHNSDYCTWTDEEAIDKATADQIFRSEATAKGYDSSEISMIEWLT